MNGNQRQSKNHNLCLLRANFVFQLHSFYKNEDKVTGLTIPKKVTNKFTKNVLVWIGQKIASEKINRIKYEKEGQHFFLALFPLTGEILPQLLIYKKYFKFCVYFELKGLLLILIYFAIKL